VIGLGAGAGGSGGDRIGAEPELGAPVCAGRGRSAAAGAVAGSGGRHCAAVPGFAEALPGDLLIFRFRPQFAAKHAGILVGADAFIHAYEQAAVIRSALVPAWRRRIAGIYRFPEIS